MIVIICWHPDLFHTTRGEGDIVDITGKVQNIVSSFGIKNGICHLFVIGSTAALTTISMNLAFSKTSQGPYLYAHLLTSGMTMTAGGETGMEGHMSRRL